jgi:hypothetical protein
MNEGVLLGPDERALREHLRSARFRSGVDDARWRLISLTWPHSLIAVSAGSRQGAPSEFTLRFDLSGYPNPGPTAGLWDVPAASYLTTDVRPKGERAGMVFRGDWNNGMALYAAWDRVALAGHPDWAQRFPKYAWNASRDLTFYLINVFDALNDEDYLGI